MLLVKRLVDGVSLLLMFYVGLHLPRSFLLLYIFVGLVIWRACLGGQALRKSLNGLRSALVLRPALILLLFSIAYGSSMLAWRFWTLPADSLDLFNSLLLPTLLFLAGAQAASFSRLWSTRVLLAYAVGGLAYLLLALMLAREPWWDWSQVFPASISVPWGSAEEMNVRSVEQNGYAALLLLAPGLLMLASSALAARLLGLAFILLSALGLHAVQSLQGRLGFVALLCAALPVLALLISRWSSSFYSAMRTSWRPRFLAAFGLSAAIAAAVSACVRFRPSDLGIWSQGVCDERFSLFASMLMRLHQAPWGGRLLRVPYWPCGGLEPIVLDPSNGEVFMAHNVFLDIYFSAGFLPVLLLLVVILPGFWVGLRGFCLAWPRWDWLVCLRWGWVCLLVCQWLFQPLLYSDGLLYYLSFFVVGLCLVEGARSFSEAQSGQ